MSVTRLSLLKVCLSGQSTSGGTYHHNRERGRLPAWLLGGSKGGQARVWDVREGCHRPTDGEWPRRYSVLRPQALGTCRELLMEKHLFCRPRITKILPERKILPGVWSLLPGA